MAVKPALGSKPKVMADAWPMAVVFGNSSEAENQLLKVDPAAAGMTPVASMPASYVIVSSWLCDSFDS